MSSSMCPHLVQEYFERVAEILVTYRPQILKQVEYDKISENLVLRGAVRQEEHERIDRCEDPEGKVSQMLVVIQNRMWGLENLLAAFMEEHVSSWLTQEMFRAYLEHLVNPLKKLQDRPQCHCVLISNSLLYRGWVKALKSLDTIILKAGNSLGFMRQTMFPTDNMLAFLSEKLAECTGGDSLSSRDELVPYGFAPNTSGEVQVAELEEDDINDLITLSETLSIGYHSSKQEVQEGSGNRETLSALAIPNNLVTQTPTVDSPRPTQMHRKNIKGFPTVAKSSPRKSPPREKQNSVGNHTSEQVQSARRKKTQTSQTENESNEAQKRRQLSVIERLSVPKTTSSSVRLRIKSPGTTTPSPGTKPRPKSAELHRSSSLSTPCSSPTPLKSSQQKPPITPPPTTVTPKIEKKTGKTSGFVRSKSVDPNSSGTKVPTKSSLKTRPTAVAKPNIKSERGNQRQSEGKSSEDSSAKDALKTTSKNPVSEAEIEKEAKSAVLFPEDQPTPENEFPQMSSLFLRNSNLSSEEEHKKNLGYYQLNFDLENE